MPTFAKLLWFDLASCSLRFEAQQTVGLERLEQSLLQLAQRSHEEPDNSTLAIERAGNNRNAALAAIMLQLFFDAEAMFSLFPDF